MIKKTIQWVIASYLILTAATSANALTYSVLEITIPNGSNIIAQGLNDAGQVVGSFAIGNTGRGFITGPNGVGITQIAPPPGDSGSGAYDINNAGQVLGYSCCSGSHPFLTGPGGVGLTAISTLGTIQNEAFRVNAAGQVVGGAVTTEGYRGFLTGANGVGITNLGTFGGGSEASDINDAGLVVGVSELSKNSTSRHAFIYGVNGAGMTDLGTLGGTNSGANGINNLGWVTGSAQTIAGQTHAFITGVNGVGMIDLGTIGGAESYGNVINDLGQVAGYGTASDGTPHAFVTGNNGMGMTDLNLLLATQLASGGYLYDAFGINASGQIIAVDNLNHSYLLTPTSVPLPGAAWLMMSGLSGLGLMARKRR